MLTYRHLHFGDCLLIGKDSEGQGQMCKSKNIFLFIGVNEALLKNEKGWKEFPWIQVWAQQLSLYQDCSSVENSGTCLWTALYDWKTRGITTYFSAKSPLLKLQFPAAYSNLEDLSQAWGDAARHHEEQHWMSTSKSSGLYCDHFWW